MRRKLIAFSPLFVVRTVTRLPGTPRDSNGFDPKPDRDVDMVTNSNSELMTSSPPNITNSISSNNGKQSQKMKQKQVQNINFFQ